MIFPHPPFVVVPMLLWGFVIVLLGTAVAFALLAWTRKLANAIWVSAGSLVMALLISYSATTSLWWEGSATSGGAAGALIALLAVALAAFGGGPAAQLALALATRGSVVPGAHGGILVDDPASKAVPATQGADAPATTTEAVFPHTREVLRGGAAIGFLERVCVVLGIIAGFPEALAIIVAVKGLGRFTELATAEARERFIIGTLASLLWAGACGVLVRVALGN